MNRRIWIIASLALFVGPVTCTRKAAGGFDCTTRRVPIRDESGTVVEYALEQYCTYQPSPSPSAHCDRETFTCTRESQ